MGRGSTKVQTSFALGALAWLRLLITFPLALHIFLVLLSPFLYSFFDALAETLIFCFRCQCFGKHSAV